MKLNIITPCVRYGNLDAISRSINIPRESYRWIVVFDNTHIPRNIPSNCEAYICVNPESKNGNAQRNYALDLITDGHVYMNDDDTELHPFLWRKIENLDDHDFIHFSQINKDGSLRLKGNLVEINHIDSHTFIVKRELIGNSRWILNEYAADGIFAKECYAKSVLPIFIPKVLSIYNSLR